MRLLVLDDAYPSPDNLYADMFAHVRVREYLARGFDCTVLASWDQPGSDYDFEGVKVRKVGSMAAIVRAYDDLKPDVTLVHFATFPLIRSLLLKRSGPFLVWVHGFEALGWYRRLFNLGRDPIHFLRYVKGNLLQLFDFRRLVGASNLGAAIGFVFVSEWMKRTTETDIARKVQRASIIPNPIDDRKFEFREKPDDQRLNILMIRPFNGKKYATDIATDAIEQLSRDPLFERLNFTFVGAGVTTSRLAKIVGGRRNVRMIEGYLSQDEIARLHRDHGLFLCPTRQDAQGVSMCEAMASGLVPISSNNTAIPEFVEDGISGMLTDNSSDAIAGALRKMADDPALFAHTSKAAAASIRAKAGMDQVIDREIALIRRMAP